MNTNNTLDREAMISQLLSVWVERKVAGKPASAEELCADRPELADELRERIGSLEWCERLAARNTHAIGLDDSAVRVNPLRMPEIRGFDLQEEIGRGGMGIVYRARQHSLQRTVAIKMILAGLQPSDEARRRFHTEAEIVAGLQHPHLVQVYEIGEHERLPFLVMEFVEGQPLAEVLRAGPFPPRDAAELTRKLADAVEFAHQHGVVHRDLKPANVLVNKSLSPKIVDFGLAKYLADNSKTVDGNLRGTPSYMAPEQTGRTNWPLGPQTDVYGLGTILYELLTGRPPFHAPTIVETIEQVVHGDPVPPRQLQPNTPVELQTICLTCLAKHPRDRYATAAALRDDLDCFLQHRAIKARPATWWQLGMKWGRRNPALATLAIVAVCLVLAGVVGGVAYETHQRAVAEQLREANRLAEAARRDAERNQALAEEREARTQSDLADASQTIRKMLDSLGWRETEPSRVAKAITTTRLDQLRDAADYFERMCEVHPEAAQLRIDFIRTLWAQGVQLRVNSRNDNARGVETKCLREIESVLAAGCDEPSKRDFAAILVALGSTWRTQRELASAEAALALAVALYDDLAAESPERHLKDQINAKCFLAWVISEQPHRAAEVIQLGDELLAVAREAERQFPENKAYLALTGRTLRRQAQWKHLDANHGVRLCDAAIAEFDGLLARTTNAEPRAAVEYHLAESYCRRGFHLFHAGDSEAAITSIQKGFDLAEERHMSSLRTMYVPTLIQCYKSLGRDAEAAAVKRS